MECCTVSPVGAAHTSAAVAVEILLETIPANASPLFLSTNAAHSEAVRIGGTNVAQKAEGGVAVDGLRVGQHGRG